jgi:hypothetical protein
MKIVQGRDNVYIIIEKNDKPLNPDVNLTLIDIGGYYDERLIRWVFPLACNDELKKFMDEYTKPSVVEIPKKDDSSDDEVPEPKPEKDETSDDDSDTDILRSSDEEIDADMIPLLVCKALDKRRKMHRATSPARSDDEDE